MLAFCVLALVALPARSAPAQTVVSLTFDDGAANQLQAQPVLLSHRMRGTFYIISGTVGLNSYYMTWSQIAGLAATGNEVAGHTRTHPDLTTLSAQAQQTQLCGNHADLLAHGFDTVSFAYPYGAGYTSTPLKQLIKQCGFASSRRVGGLTHSGCGSCVNAESIPPGDAYALRSNAPHDDNSPLTLSELQTYVIQAANAGGGWVPITFHDICDNCPTTAEAGSISPSAFTAFLDWLSGQAPNVVVMSVKGVMGFPESPLPELVKASSAPPPPPVADKTVSIASLMARSKQRIGNLYVLATMGEAGTLSAGGTVGVPGASKVFRFKAATANAVPGVAVKLRLKLSKKGLRAAKRALRRHHRLTARLEITARDKAGNVKVQPKTVRLKR